MIQEHYADIYLIIYYKAKDNIYFVNHPRYKLNHNLLLVIKAMSTNEGVYHSS